MAQELLYTSAARGLKPGSRGFCTVVSTHGMAAPLAECLESLSGYRPVYPPNDSAVDDNPVAWSHFQVSVGGKTLSILSRIAAYGLDYTQRSNKLAHHVVLDSSERPKCGPAALLGQTKLMRDAWDGNTELIERSPIADSAPKKRGPDICTAWQQATGDAGWAGVLAEAFLGDPQRQVYILFQPGTNVLPLIEEALSLIPEERRWEVTFSTYVNNLPKRATCLWRCVVKDSPEANQSRRFVRALRIDLTEPLGRAEGGALVESARTGKPAVEAIPQRPPETVGHIAQSSPPTSIAPEKPSTAPIPVLGGADTGYGVRQSPITTKPSPPPFQARRGKRSSPIRWSTAVKGLGVLVVLAVVFLLGYLSRPLVSESESAVAVTQGDGAVTVEIDTATAKPTLTADRTTDKLPVDRRDVKEMLSMETEAPTEKPTNASNTNKSLTSAASVKTNDSPAKNDANKAKQNVTKSVTENVRVDRKQKDKSYTLPSLLVDTPPKEISDYKVINILQDQQSIELPLAPKDGRPKMTFYQPEGLTPSFTDQSNEKDDLNIIILKKDIPSGGPDIKVGTFNLSPAEDPAHTKLTFHHASPSPYAVNKLCWCLIRVSGKSTHWVKLINIDTPSNESRQLNNRTVHWVMSTDKNSIHPVIFRPQLLECEVAQIEFGLESLQRVITFVPFSEATSTSSQGAITWKHPLTAKDFPKTLAESVGDDFPDKDTPIQFDVNLRCEDNECHLTVELGKLERKLKSAFNKWAFDRTVVDPRLLPRQWYDGNPSAIKPLPDNFKFLTSTADRKLNQLTGDIKKELSELSVNKNKYISRLDKKEKKDAEQIIDRYKEHLEQIANTNIPDILKLAQTLNAFIGSLKVGFLQQMKVIYHVKVDDQDYPVPLIDIQPIAPDANQKDGE